ncbi:MAG TPA: GNAT family N-acetyltransferase [Symbiobacteriaceae bacterium]|jgi:aminoglycoside 6'-N-acetyltransferase|nr:GNAT family N-acetyltransferase [Symbiobacteriaceae bacterium]
MHLNAALIRFRRLTVAEIPLLYHWITNDPVIDRIWNGGVQPTFDQVTRKYQAYVTGARPTTPYLILYGDTPIGYIQTYLWQDYPEYGQYLDLTAAASLDVLIGEAAYRNKGLGPALLTGFLREHVFCNPDVRSCIITPEVGNTAAIRAYEKAGFRHVRTVTGIPDEPGPVYFMAISREDCLEREAGAALHRLTPEDGSGPSWPTHGASWPTPRGSNRS